MEVKQKVFETLAQVKEEYYKTHSPSTDDVTSEETKIERWVEEMGYEVIEE